MERVEQVKYGKLDEQRHFESRHPEFREAFPHLHQLCEKVFLRKVATDDRARLVVFTLGRLVVEDFIEILLLCANGYGVAGLKLLRGMFERVVTAGYLSDHPEEVTDFLDYHYVQQMKWIEHTADLAIDLRERLTDDQIAELRKNYERVKGRYRDTVSWTKKDLKTMAIEVDLKEFYGPLYFWPTLQSHTTVASILSRVQEDEGGGISFISGPQRTEADGALFGAHTCLGLVLEHQNTHFSLGLDDEIRKMQDLYKRCWPKEGSPQGRRKSGGI